MTFQLCPNYVLSLSGERKIKKYFREGYAYKEIVGLLFERDQIRLSTRQLKRILKKLGLTRRKSNCSFQELCEVVEVSDYFQNI